MVWPKQIKTLLKPLSLGKCSFNSMSITLSPTLTRVTSHENKYLSHRSVPPICFCFFTGIWKPRVFNWFSLLLATFSRFWPSSASSGPLQPFAWPPVSTTFLLATTNQLFLLPD